MNVGKLVIGTEINTKKFDAQIKALERKVNDVKATLKMAEEDKTLFSTREIEEMEAETEKLDNQIENLKNKSKKTSDNFSKGFDKGIKSLKRFALSLFSVGSIYAAVSKASSAYLSQNEELSNKLKSVWVGLGSIIGPAIEYVSNALLKGLGYLNEFIKALTGVDFIAKANAKALEKQAKSQQKLNQATQDYDFDVIRKQQTNDNSISTNTGTPSGFIEIPELNQKVVDKLKDLAKWLRENKELIEEVGVAIGLVFGTIAISKLLKNISTLMGSEAAGTGLAGLAGLLQVLAAVVSIVIIIKNFKKIKEDLEGLIEDKNKLSGMRESVLDERIKALDEFYKNYDKLSPEQQKTGYYLISQKEVTKNLTKTEDLRHHLQLLQVGIATYTKLYKAGKLTEEGKKDYFKLLEEEIALSKRVGDNTKALEEEYLILTGVSYDAARSNELLNKTLFAGSKVFNSSGILINKFSKDLEKVGTVTDIVQKKYTEDLLKIMNDTKTWDDDTKEKIANQIQKMQDLGFNVNELKEKYKKLTGEEYTIRVTGDFEDKSGSKIQQYINKLKNLLNVNNFSNFFGGAASSIFKKLGIKGLAKGGIVTQPTRALIGEAGYPEAVVPMTQDYLSTLASEIGKYSSGGKNQVVNIYLDGRLIQRQMQSVEDNKNFATNK